MNFFKKNVSLFLILFLFAGSAFAQGQQQMMQQQIKPIPADSVTDADLEAMIALNQQIQPLLMQTNMKIQQVIQSDSSLTPERTQTLMQAQMSGTLQDMDVSQSEQQALNKITQIQQQFGQQQTQAVEQSDLSMQRVQRLDATLRNNEEVMNRLRAMMSDTTGGGNGGGNR